METKLTTPTTVEFVVSKVWDCPKCGNRNEQSASRHLKKFVTCQGCKEVFAVKII